MQLMSGTILPPMNFGLRILVVLGPLPSDDILLSLIDDLEQSGLVYFDDFFELSGNWPEWLTLYAQGAKTGRS